MSATFGPTVMTTSSKATPTEVSCANIEDMRKPADPDRLLTVEDMERYTGRKASTIRVDVTRRPETLPPRWHIPGTRLVRWRLGDVVEWMRENSKPVARKKRSKGNA